MAEGVDYSGARPSSICMYGKGKRFVARYFGAGGSWKHATAAEVRAHHAVGLSVVALVEGAIHDPLNGRAQGRSHATVGELAAKAAGMPQGRPLYFAIDWDMQPHQAGKVAEYLRGCADVITVNRVGVYGGYDTIEWAAKAGLAKWFFQTYAWSRGKWSGRNHFEQYNNGEIVCGGTVDLCRSKKVDFGQWPAPTQNIGDAPGAPSDSTVDTGWDFTPHVDSIAGAVGEVAQGLAAVTRQLNDL